MFNFSLKILQVRSNARNEVMTFWVTKVRFTDVSSQRFLDSQTFWFSEIPQKCYLESCTFIRWNKIVLILITNCIFTNVSICKQKSFSERSPSTEQSLNNILISIPIISCCQKKNENIYLLISCVLILPVLGTTFLHIQTSQLFFLIIIWYIFKSCLWK